MGNPHSQGDVEGSCVQIRDLSQQLCDSAPRSEGVLVGDPWAHVMSRVCSGRGGRPGGAVFLQEPPHLGPPASQSCGNWGD